VNIARHLERFPTDGVIATVENVLAFDAFDRPLRDQLTQVFSRHGIPVGACALRCGVPVLILEQAKTDCSSCRQLRHRSCRRSSSWARCGHEVGHHRCCPSQYIARRYLPLTNPHAELIGFDRACAPPRA
jgi:hypothetical protein